MITNPDNTISPQIEVVAEEFLGFGLPNSLTVTYAYLDENSSGRKIIPTLHMRIGDSEWWPVSNIVAVAKEYPQFK